MLSSQVDHYEKLSDIGNGELSACWTIDKL